ncbi:MAG: hypothetical protein SV062_11880 [Thermodesulfobacteriota bacterium]|nr:hypothetical protein [Thermodesulfobacteriota bacterium]
MGNCKKHLKIAKEKLKAVVNAYNKRQNTVVGDLSTKVVEQLIEADAARNNEHFGTHSSRHEYSNKNFPKEINFAMKKVWFAYSDLGYDGINSKRAKAVIENFNISTGFF